MGRDLLDMNVHQDHSTSSFPQIQSLTYGEKHDRINPIRGEMLDRSQMEEGDSSQIIKTGITLTSEIGVHLQHRTLEIGAHLQHLPGQHTDQNLMIVILKGN